MLCAVSSTAAADDYPDRPVRLIVPFAPGGGNDFLARLAGRKLGEALGQPFVIDNRAGGGGVIATGLVAKSAPDGYTLLLGFIGPLAIAPSLGRVSYDPFRDFAAVSMLASSYHVMVINPTVTARTVRELIALAGANPGRINYASGGSGTPLHLVAELFNSVTGIDIVHIPYKGSGPAATAVASGEVQMAFGSISSLLPFIRGGQLVALAVTGPKRSPLVPEVPTLAEAGLEGIDVASWYALVAPAAIPGEAMTRLNAAVTNISAAPEYRKQLAGRGFEPIVIRPYDFPEFLRAETSKWARVIKAAGISAD